MPGCLRFGNPSATNENTTSIGTVESCLPAVRRPGTSDAHLRDNTPCTRLPVCLYKVGPGTSVTNYGPGTRYSRGSLPLSKCLWTRSIVAKSLHGNTFHFFKPVAPEFARQHL